MGMEQLITPKEAATALKVELPTIYTWVARRQIPFQKVGRALRFSPSALTAWLAGQARPPSNSSEVQP